jgi:hypothetical protein
MINLAQTNVHTGLTLEHHLESHNRQRMKLAIALFDVEIAHTHLAELDASDRQYPPRLEQLKAALEAYWRIDDQIERYLKSARGN